MDNKKESVNSTEQRILEAAKSVFLEKGMDGARMQEIADRAGINKALLHYYFRSKDKLFITIFRNIIRNLFKQINLHLQNNNDVFEFIEKFVTTYTVMLQQNQFLPNFVINEMNRNHENVVQIFASENLIQYKSKLDTMIERSVAAGKIIPITSAELIIDMIGLCVFPIVAKPMILNFLLQGDANEHNSLFVEGRSKHVINLLKQAITPHKQTK